MEDLLEQANEVQESLGRSYAVPDELDEADLEAGMSREHPSHPLSLIALAELDALGLEEEDEGPSYLSELNKAPDFVDEAPVEEVSSFWCETAHTLSPLVDVEQRGCSGIQLICRKASLRAHISVINVAIDVQYVIQESFRVPHRRPLSVLSYHCLVCLVLACARANTRRAISYTSAEVTGLSRSRSVPSNPSRKAAAASSCTLPETPCPETAKCCAWSIISVNRSRKVCRWCGKK
jgi:hypothetical protein